MNTKMYVGNLPFQVTEDEIRDMFAEHGEVSEVAVVMDRETGRPRGFAFVTMADADGMNAAIENLHDTEIGDRRIVVNEARPREERSGGGGGGRGGRGGYGGGGGGRGGRGGDRGGDRGGRGGNRW